MINESPKSTKVILLGDSGVGKTSIVLQLDRGIFISQVESTIGVSFIKKTFETSRGPILLHICDTAGQERFRSVVPIYMRGCMAVVYVCSVNNTSSMQNLELWRHVLAIQGDISTKNEGNAPFEDKVMKIFEYVAINKTDVEYPAPGNAAETWAEEKTIPFFYTAASQSGTLTPLFARIAEDLSFMCGQTWHQEVPHDKEKVQKRQKCCK